MNSFDRRMEILNYMMKRRFDTISNLEDLIKMRETEYTEEIDIIIKKETKMWCSSGTMHLEFKFNDGTKKSFYFDCENLVYDNTHYELKEDVILVNKDEYIPDKITNTMIVVENKDEIECK